VIRPELEVERAGVIVIRDGRLALIHRVRDGREYWVIPGGGVERGENLAEAALREGREELGSELVLGPLRVRIAHRLESGRIQIQSYFEASIATDQLSIRGPELSHGPERGSYRAVWLPLAEVRKRDVLPGAVAVAVTTHAGIWPAEVIEIVER
jgi:8-oxo-dGTP pyrophosphatase MutT (NUDIX family)